MRLKNEFYQQPTLKVAKENYLVKKLFAASGTSIVSGWIVEVEAYLWRGDEACHANRGITKRNETMFVRPGTALRLPNTRQILYECGNGSRRTRRSRPHPSGCEPIDGIGKMRHFRGINELEQLTNGPGKCARLLTSIEASMELI